VYQPIVDLDTREVVAYEALARGPVGSALERPDLLFQTARACGLLAELEWACRAAALRGALDARLRKTLFVNVEPSVLDVAMPESLIGLFDRAARELDVVVELTERALTDKPAEVLSRVETMRARGLMVALDDIGADHRSLALMPFVDPEVIKLDLRLVQENPSPAIAAIVHAVNAQAERSGAVLLAEGIETEDQLAVALALGARYGQGWLFGRPAELPEATTPLPAPLAPRRVSVPAPSSPYRAVAAHVRPRRGTKALLLSISRHLEAQVAAQGECAVVFAAFQDARHFTPRSAARYEQLAASAALVGALGVGLPSEPVPGVRGADLAVTDSLAGEWNVTVIAPHFAAAFVARDLGDTDCPDMERRFDFCLTYDRDLAIQAARGLLARIAPQ
jgi:EAL domain-containing protein (putative c-di-GMP-specific phosphodiesterase class I)